MRERLNRPKRFGEILDVVFSLSRHRFIDFLKIYIIIIGPIILLELLVQISLGKSFFREVGAGTNWLEQTINSLLAEEEFGGSTEEDFANTAILFLTTFFGVFAQVAILYAVNQIRKGKDFSVGTVAKQAFSRFLPIIGASALLFAIILMSIISIAFVSFIAVLILDSVATWLAVSIIIGLGLLYIIVLIYFGIRYSFYIARIALGDQVIQSFRKSWILTKGRVGFIFGLYFVFIVIINIIFGTFEVGVGIALGGSILFTILVSIVGLITSMITSVGYAVVYFDLDSRHDATDLKEMIEQYKQ